MMTQTLALLLDAYREMQAKKMFWIVLGLNVLVVAAFSLLGANDRAFTLLWFEIPTGGGDGPGIPPLYVYKSIFSGGVVGLWFTWVAALLALISTAGIFPDFLSSGSVDLFLAKPLTRIRLFFTKYFAGLLFVTLQVSVFTLLCFLVLGLRAGLWEPGLFSAIPLVVIFFSYLFGICVLIGVLTRSTVAALMLTLLAWVGIWGLDAGERILSSLNDMQTLRVASLDDEIEATKGAMAAASTAPAPIDPEIAGQNRDDSLQELTRRHEALVEQRKNLEYYPALDAAQKIVYGVKTLIPKTRETLNVLDRVLFNDKELKEAARQAEERGPGRQFRRGPPGRRMQERELAIVQRERERPLWWVIGTSLVFEGIVLAIAAWYFHSRDF